MVKVTECNPKRAKLHLKLHLNGVKCNRETLCALDSYKPVTLVTLVLEEKEFLCFYTRCVYYTIYIIYISLLKVSVTVTFGHVTLVPQRFARLHLNVT